jgi:transposase
MPRSLWARGRPHSGDHRHAGGESDRKRGGSIDPVGYDAGKKIKGVKRNALVDTEGHLLSLEVIPANIQDRDSAASLIGMALQKYPRLKKIFADGGYAGPKLASQLVGLPVELDIVKRTDQDAGFKVVRRRWVIERTFSWLRRNRRLMAHYEALAMTAVGFAKLAMIGVMLKRLTEAVS